MVVVVVVEQDKGVVVVVVVVEQDEGVVVVVVVMEQDKGVVVVVERDGGVVVVVERDEGVVVVVVVVERDERVVVVVVVERDEGVSSYYTEEFVPLCQPGPHLPSDMQISALSLFELHFDDEAIDMLITDTLSYAEARKQSKKKTLQAVQAYTSN